MTNSSKLSLKNTNFAGSSMVTLTGGTLELGGTIGNLSSVQTDTNTSLELNSDTTISRTDPMEAGGLNLKTFSLTLGSATTDLTFNSPIVLNNAASELITQDADLVLQDSLQLTKGKITSTAGTFTFTKGGSSGTNSTLDLSGTKLKLKEDLSVQNGTLTTNNNSILHLLDNVTVTYNGEKTFKALELNGKVLTLGSASTDLKVLDALTLSSNTLQTGDADLTLAVTLNTNSLIDSTGGTLKISGTVDNSSEIAMPGTELALIGDLAIAGTLTTGANTTINRNNNELDLSGTLIKLGGDLNLAGSVTDNATLSLIHI